MGYLGCHGNLLECLIQAPFRSTESETLRWSLEIYVLTNLPGICNTSRSLSHCLSVGKNRAPAMLVPVP